MKLVQPTLRLHASTDDLPVYVQPLPKTPAYSLNCQFDPNYDYGIEKLGKYSVSTAPNAARPQITEFWHSLDPNNAVHFTVTEGFEFGSSDHIMFITAEFEDLTRTDRMGVDYYRMAAGNGVLNAKVEEMAQQLGAFRAKQHNESRAIRRATSRRVNDRG